VPAVSLRIRGPGRSAAVLLAYFAIAIAVLRPPKGALTGAVVAGTEPCDTVPFALSWAIGWAHARLDAPAAWWSSASWWDAPIFHPIEGALALSESMPLLAVVTWPAHALGLPLAGCTTLAVFATLVANGWFVRRWLLWLRTGPTLASIGGAIAVLLPFVHQELGVLPLVGVWPLVWMIQATGELLDARTGARARRGAVELGLATAAGVATCGQLTLATALLLPACGAWLLRREHLRGAVVLPAILALVIAAAGSAPIALPQRATLEALGLRRTEQSQDRGAGRPRELWRVPWSGLVPLPAAAVAAHPTDRAFDPGPLRTIAAAAGAIVVVRSRRRRRHVAMLLTLVAGAILLAFAPRIVIAGWEPSEFLAEHVPGYGQIRAVFRAIVLAQLGVLALAMLGLRALQVRLRARKGGPKMVWIAAVLLLVELTPPAPRWATLPDTDAAWLIWLRDEAPADAPIAWIPFPATGDVCDYAGTAAAMLLGLEHGHPMVNGYSSYFPGPYNRAEHAARKLPHGRGIVALRVLGTRYLVAPDGGPLDGIDAARRELLRIHPVLRDDAAGVTIWEIDPSS